MSLPRIAELLVRRSVPDDRVADLLGDLEEVHRTRVETQGHRLASFYTTLESVEWAAKSIVERLRRTGFPPTSWIDFKLGVRMLVKYPGLTLVGGLAIAFAVFVGAGCFETYSQILHPTLPLDDGDRVVMVELTDDRTGNLESRILHDFSAWRTGLATVEELGAAQLLVPNLGVGGSALEPVRAAAMTASTFRMTRTPPLKGRALLPSDESPTAPDVLVIGHDLWQRRFGAASDVVGRTVVLGDARRTVVGVMPPGFAFPANQEAWIPLRIDPGLEALTGPPVIVYGRLAPGATPDRARREVDARVGAVAADGSPDYEHLHAGVLPYAEARRWGITGDLSERVMIMSTNVYAALFLILVCGNVALLMFARVAAREGEIVVRAALGATRRRIVGQLFSEALALSLVAGVVGVVAAAYGFSGLVNAFTGGGGLAFWYHLSLSPATVVYCAGLAVLAALIAGVVPGLKITAGGMESRLRGSSAGGGGLRLGGAWTAIIVLQIAATVTFPVVGWFVRQEAVRMDEYEPRYASEEFVTARLALNVTAPVATPDSVGDGRERTFERRARELEARLETEPAVAGVTLARTNPAGESSWRRIEVDAGGETPRNELDEKGEGRMVSGELVAPDFFEVFEISATEGRTFSTGDADPNARTVVVNEPFVDEVLGGRNAIGRRLRYLRSYDGWDGGASEEEPGPWYRIVGVVPPLGTTTAPPSGAPRARIYHAVAPGSRWARTLLVRVNGDPGGSGALLREIAADVDPDLSLLSLQPLDLARERDRRFLAYWIRMIALVSIIAMVLSVAGIYSVMSFTVARRTREIGVRVALGAGPVRVLGATFRRPLIQIGAGLATGLVLCLLLAGGMELGTLRGKPLLILLGYAVLMIVVCLSACVVPTVRALSIEPSEALGADG